jgi:translocator protein
VTSLDLTWTRRPADDTDDLPTRSVGAQAAGLMVSIVLVAAVALTGRVWTDTGPDSWYAGLQQPDWNPPDAAFGPVWTALYLAMAVAAWLVWRARERRRERQLALAVYGVQLALNLGWTAVFFGLQRPGWALVEISVLALAVAVTIGLFWNVNRFAGALLLPYLAWVVFAASLNAGVSALN